MIPKITMKVKSKEEILSTLTNLDGMGDETYGVLKSNTKLGTITIPDWLWTTCGRVIGVRNTSLDTHNFDYNFFDFPEPNEERVSVPVLYYMSEWLEDVTEQATEQDVDEMFIGDDDELE